MFKIIKTTNTKIRYSIILNSRFSFEEKNQVGLLGSNCYSKVVVLVELQGNSGLSLARGNFLHFWSRILEHEALELQIHIWLQLFSGISRLILTVVLCCRSPWSTTPHAEKINLGFQLSCWNSRILVFLWQGYIFLSFCYSVLWSSQAVIDFTASWCGPCRVIAPFFVELAKRFTDVIFLKVDIDELKVNTSCCIPLVVCWLRFNILSSCLT